VATRLGKTAEEEQAKLLGRQPNAAVAEQNLALLAQGADPARVGEQVVEALQNRQFLIITHREWEPLVLAVHREVEQAFTEFDGRHGPDATAQLLLAGPSPIAT
jgi:alpha-glucuronidase